MAAWAALLDAAPVPFSKADELAMYRAGLVAYALSPVGDDTGKAIDLSSVLSQSKADIEEAYASDR